MQVFLDRSDAGKALAEALADHPEVNAADRVVVLAIPRGGLPIGAAVARALDADFDVVVVRKLRAPHNAELGFGAVGPGGHVDIDEQSVQRLRISQSEIDAEVADRRAAVERRLSMYRAVAPEVPLEGALAIVVDDGVATGGTARQACRFAQKAGAARVLLATPVAPPGAREGLTDAADDVVVLSSPAEFMAVGQAYQDFSQLDDQAALAVLQSGVASR